MTERERALLQGKKINPLTANESALAYAVAHGGSAPTYEVVAEIQVGDPVEDTEWIPKGCAAYFVADTASAKAIMASAGDNLFFKSAETPLTRLDNRQAIFGSNFEISEEKPVVIGNPAYLVAAANEDENDATVEFISTEDLSNTTVRILKKVERAGESGVLIVEATGGRTETIDGKSVTILSVSTPAKTVADAIKAGRPIDLVVGSSGNGYGLATRYPLALELLGSSSGWSGSAGGAAIMHSDGETVSYASINVREDGNGGYEYYLPESTYGQITGDGAQSVYGSVVPLATSADAGKVLTVNSSGIPEWVTPT